MTVAWAMSKPKSIKSILRDAGLKPGGSIREELSRQIDDALFSLWSAMAEQDPEDAAVALFALLTRDPNYRRALWIDLVFKRHRAAIHRAVTNGVVRQVSAVYDSVWT